MRTLAWIAANVLCAALCCQGCAGSGPEPARATGAAPGPDELVIDGLALERWVGGRLRVSARAERAVVDRGRGTLTAQQVEIEARDADGATRGHLRGSELEAALSGARAELRGDVVVVDAVGRTLTATVAVYTAADERVRAPGHVRMEGANFRAEGQGLEADLARGVVVVGGPVEANVQ